MFLLLRSISLWFSLPEVEEEKKKEEGEAQPRPRVSTGDTHGDASGPSRLGVKPRMLGVHRERGQRGQGGEATPGPCWKPQWLPGLTFPHPQEGKGIAPLLPKQGHLAAGDLNTVHPRVDEIPCTVRATRCAAKTWVPALLGKAGLAGGVVGPYELRGSFKSQPVQDSE